VKTVSDVAAVSEQTNKMLPIANRMCRLLCTALVTVAGNERSFSKLKLVKNYLRTTQSDSRLSDFLLLSSEKDIIDDIKLDIIAKQWSI
jgi:hypothetical protein